MARAKPRVLEAGRADARVTLLNTLITKHQLDVKGATLLKPHMIEDSADFVAVWKVYDALSSWVEVLPWKDALVSDWRLSTTATSNAAYLAKLTRTEQQGGDKGSTRFFNVPRGTPMQFRLMNAHLAHAIKPSLPQEFTSYVVDKEERVDGSTLPPHTAFECVLELNPVVHRDDICQFFRLYVAILESMVATPKVFHPSATTVRDFSMQVPCPLKFNPSTNTFELSIKFRAPELILAVDYIVVKRGKSELKGKDYSITERVVWKTIGSVDKPVLLRGIPKKREPTRLVVLPSTRFGDEILPSDVHLNDTISILFNKPSMHEGSSGYQWKFSASKILFVNDSTGQKKEVDVLADEDVADEDDIAEYQEGVRLAASASAFKATSTEITTPLAGSKRARVAEAAVPDMPKSERLLRQGISTLDEDDEPLGLPEAPAQ